MPKRNTLFGARRKRNTPAPNIRWPATGQELSIGLSTGRPMAGVSGEHQQPEEVPALTRIDVGGALPFGQKSYIAPEVPSVPEVGPNTA